MIYQDNGKIPVREVILHCAAIRAGQFKGMRPLQVFSTINRWHVERGFQSFGYHGLFMPDGEFFAGRPPTFVGAHCKGRNRGTIGLLLIESQQVERIGEFADYFTEVQRLAVRAKIAEYGGIERVSGHNFYANKLCPGFTVKTEDWL